MEELGKIDFLKRSGGRVTSIEGVKLCPESYCILGENTVCQEDALDYRPYCVSPCKLTSDQNVA